MFEIILLFLLLVLSGFFSSSELAHVISNKIIIEIRARKNNLSAKYALYFSTKPQVFFSTILISNNVINIAFASLIAIYLKEGYGWSDEAILLISSVLLLFFGELIPKYIATVLPDTLTLLTAIPLKIISILLFPIAKFTSGVSSILTRSNQRKDDLIYTSVEKHDIQLLLEESMEAGNVEEADSDFINKVIDLGEQKIYEAMTPRTDIVGVEINSSIDKVIDTFVESGYSKLPVFEDNIDNIKGIVIAYDMFKKPESLKSVIREMIFVPETKMNLDTLNELLDKGVSTAVVVDEFGGTEGLVTIEDILEEIVGEIRDEFDVDEDVCKKINNDTFVISGRVEIDYINEEHDLFIPEGDYETIAGYITQHTGFIPSKGESFNLNHFKILILRSDKTRIDLVKLHVDLEKLNELNSKSN